MIPWFVLSYPRSRTAWLSVFLQGAGVPCFHEAWKQAKTTQELRQLMERAGDGPVVNSDSSNVFFLPELIREFPEAKYILIEHDLNRVLDSLACSYGPHDYTDMMEWYRTAFAWAQGVEAIRIDCRTWDESVSSSLYQSITGRAVDQRWLEQVSGMLVELMPATIRADTQAASEGVFTHIEQHMRRLSWV